MWTVAIKDRKTHEVLETTLSWGDNEDEAIDLAESQLLHMTGKSVKEVDFTAVRTNIYGEVRSG